MSFQSIVKPELAERYAKSGLWMNRTCFEFLAERAEAHPDREVFADANGRITYGELKNKVERCAQFLHSIGITRGDVVTIQLPNRITFPIVFFSLELIGAVANKVNPDFRSRELDYILKFSNSRAVVCPREFKGFDYVAMAKSLQASIPGLTHVIISGGAPEGTFDLDKGIANSPPLAAEHRVRMDPNEVYRMAFTSGTTGDPKCVLHSFNTTMCVIRQANIDMEVSERDVLLIFLPVGLNWGYILVLQTIAAGARAILMERFSAAGALEAIERERITYIATAPAGILAMLNDPSLDRRDVSSLRVVITGGASAAVETIREFRRRMHGHLIEVYGMLETGFHTHTRFTDDPEQVTGTIGRLIADMELKVIDEKGNEVPRGEIGEIAARGPSVHLGYHNNPSANDQAFTEDGWFRTGDLARYVDEAGNIQITGRSKEIINRGGKKFFPREVEEILYTHPKIMHAAMIGIPDPRLGEQNCLCVVPKPQQTLELADVVTFLKGQVADYKLPEMLQLCDELPMTPTGKIRRPVLRDQILQRIGGVRG
jgi:non-ribosomal peptide synthetase component E (peptide arylation enzyme)